MNFKKYQHYFFVLPVIAVVFSIGALLVFGLQLGIDLKGGSLLQVTYTEGRPELQQIQAAVSNLGVGEIRVQGANETDYILRLRELNVEEKQRLDDLLATLGSFEEVQFTSIGPSIGSELMRKAWWAVGLVALTTIIFIAFAFRGVSRPIASWKYGAVAIVTLMHDVLIPTGLFAFLGYVRGAEVSALFIVALLTILGISINDTIVVFDRIRENLNRNMEKKIKEPYADVVWRSVSQTIARSINTSLTVVIVLVALFFLGPEATKDMALTLIVGMIAGSYSSIFLASPLLVYWEKHQKPPREEESEPKKMVNPTPRNVPLNLSGLN
jgi:preprotein translocase subunit SecF